MIKNRVCQIAAYPQKQFEKNLRAIAVRKSRADRETLQAPRGFDWREFSREAFGIAHGEKTERIRLLFSAKVATYIRERVWHPSLRQHRDGSLEMRIKTSGHKELVRWVLSWMPDVEVLAPRKLRDRVREKLSEALDAAAHK